TKKLENVINVFQRNFLRKILKIKYPDTIRNSVLYRKTKEVPWSKKIRIRRLRWCGHLLRLPDKAPAKIALNEIIKVEKVNKRRNKKTWKKVVIEDLRIINNNYSIDDVNLRQLAEDREWWDRKVVYEASAMSAEDDMQI